jgi:hypothetical protein
VLASVVPLDDFKFTVTYFSVGAVAIVKLLAVIKVEVMLVGVTFMVPLELEILRVIPVAKFVPVRARFRGVAWTIPTGEMAVMVAVVLVVEPPPPPQETSARHVRVMVRQRRRQEKSET